MAEEQKANEKFAGTVNPDAPESVKALEEWMGKGLPSCEVSPLPEEFIKAVNFENPECEPLQVSEFIFEGKKNDG